MLRCAIEHDLVVGELEVNFTGVWLHAHWPAASVKDCFGRLKFVLPGLCYHSLAGLVAACKLLFVST